MKSDFQLKIINFLKEERLKHNFSQLKVGELLGISNGQVGCIESPKFPHKYTLAQIVVLCHEFGIRIEHLFLPENDCFISHDVIEELIERIVEYEN